MLSLSRLKTALLPLYVPATMPKSDAIGAWARAYATYASDVVAGPTKPASPPVPPPASGDFLTGLDGVIRSMWMTVAWVGPGVTGVTALVPDIRPVLLVNSTRMAERLDQQAALDAIAQSIHTYTLSITVTVTTAAGVTSVVTIA